MRVFYGFDELPRLAHPVVTLGSYDGVHRGHKEILGRIKELAKSTQGESVVITFSPHPRQVLERESNVKVLNSLQEKIWLLEQEGVDNLIVAPFTREFSRVSSYDFVRDYLVGMVEVATLVVGYDHHFGHNQEGDFNYLTSLQNEFGFKIYMIPAKEVKQDQVSSTVIRELIAKGDVYQAEEYLGRPYFIIAKLVGQRMELEESIKLLPPSGVYEVEVDDGTSRDVARLVIGGDGSVGLEGWRGWDRGAEFIRIIFEERDKN